jgi:hypothetical protein
MSWMHFVVHLPRLGANRSDRHARPVPLSAARPSYSLKTHDGPDVVHRRSPGVTKSDTTCQFRDEDRRTGRKLGEPFGEVGGGFLYGASRSFSARDRDGSSAPKLRLPPDHPGVARSCLTTTSSSAIDDRCSQMGGLGMWIIEVGRTMGEGS